MTAIEAPPATGKLYYGWKVLGAAMVVTALGGGIFSYGFSVFFIPLRETLGISAASASLIFSMSRGQGAIEGPIAGYLIDRFGARMMLAAGATLMAVGYLLLSQAHSYIAVLLIYLLVISVGMNCGFSHALLALVNAWFSKRRGFAMAVASSAPAIGGSVIAPILGIVVAVFGWRFAAGASGATVLILLLPVLLIVRRSPESMGLRVDGGVALPRNEGDSRLQADDEPYYGAREAMHTTTYWVLLVGTLLRACPGGAITIHFVAIMVSKGMDETLAAGFLGIFALLSVPLRIIAGWIGDHWSRPYYISVTMVIGAISMMIWNYTTSEAFLWVFLFLFAVSDSNPSLNWALIGDFFGRRQFATIRGSMTFFNGWASMATPLLAGLVWDATGSYSIVLWTFTIMFLVGAVIFLVLRPPKPRPLIISPVGEVPAV